MKASKWLAAQAAGSLLLGASALMATEIPKVVYSDLDGSILFVRADSAMKSAGQIDPSLFSPKDYQTIRLYSQLPVEGDCVRLRGLLYDFHPNDRRFESTKDATGHSKIVVDAVVAAEAPGFMGEEAGTLLGVEVHEVLKGELDQPASGYFVFFPVGRLDLGGRSYCALNPDWPSLPAVGEHVLLFLRQEPGQSRYLALLDGGDVVVLSSQGPRMPRRFEKERAIKLRNDDVLAAVRAYVRAETEE